MKEEITLNYLVLWNATVLYVPYARRKAHRATDACTFPVVSNINTFLRAILKLKDIYFASLTLQGGSRRQEGGRVQCADKTFLRRMHILSEMAHTCLVGRAAFREET